MMTLIALAISVAYFYSVAITFLGGKDTLLGTGDAYYNNASRTLD